MNLNKLVTLVVFALFPLIAFSASVEREVISKITLEKGNSPSQLNKHMHKHKVKQNLINQISERLDNKEPIRLFGQDLSFESLSGESSGTHLLRFSASAKQFTTGKLNVSGAKHATLFLNAEHVKGSDTFDISLLNQDYRVLLIVSGIESWDNLNIEWEVDANGEKEPQVVFGDDLQSKRASMKQYYDSQTVGTLNLSPNGKLLIWSKSHYTNSSGDKPQQVTEIISVDDQKVVYRWQAMSPRHLSWRHDSEALVFIHDSSVYQLDIDSKTLSELASDVSDVRAMHYLSENELLITWHQAEDKPHPFTKRYRALQDRWNYWRGNTQLHVFDMQSGFFKQLTNDSLSVNLLDLDTDSRLALFTRSPVDYNEPPHSLTQLFELDLDTLEETKLGDYRSFNSAQYSGKGLMITAGPTFADNAGLALKNEPMANLYDTQLYYMTKNGEVTALSKDFSPAINQMEVLQNGDVLLLVTEKDRRKLYLYETNDKKFSLINTKVDVVSGYSVSDAKRPQLVYKGTTATRPQSVYISNLGSKKQTALYDSASQNYQNVEFIDVKDWSYTTESGQFIDGRVYYPADFDANKKYPAIVYYYGGTTPVTRGYTGRWPFSLWASKGYVVYVLQPSGTIGYGQDFSARHVNAWGIHTADDIIESTQAFVDAHPFVDPTRLGNMGASYGGFMTMYLATKTDMFAASISHAGISNLTSYWGEGWWGYGYSGIATRGTFPWNKSQFYVDQSPVFAADKVTTPLLLIHGDADTNVPVGESHQMYTALKLLGKDVELIEFQGDDHHINSRERRLRWWSTILAYFDLKLKDEPLWWEDLYPPVEQK